MPWNRMLLNNLHDNSMSTHVKWADIFVIITLSTLQSTGMLEFRSAHFPGEIQTLVNPV